MNPKLSAGPGYVFCGQNWKSSADDKWTDHLHYLPHGREPFFGFRHVRGVEVGVFRCLDDDYFGQSKSNLIVGSSEAPTEPEDA